MSWQSNLMELRAYIAKLENDLAEVDAMISTHAYTIDPSPPQNWPKGSILAKAMHRHAQRCADEIERRNNRLVQS
jgi:hypothetical protein